MNPRTILALRKFRYGVFGYTRGQVTRFFLGIVVGFLLAAMIMVASTDDKKQDTIKLEVARESGYSECCMDFMTIISHGGGLDDIIAFARAEGKSRFSSAVSPTNFYPVH